MSHKMKGFIFVRIVCLLKNRDVISSTFMKIFVFITVYRINFKTNIPKILWSKLASLTYVLNITCTSALTCKHKNFFNTRIGNDFHFMLYFIGIEFLSVNIIVTVKSAINAVIFTIISNIKRCKKIYCVAKMFTCLYLSLLCHLLEKRSCCRWQKCLKILYTASLTV